MLCKSADQLRNGQRKSVFVGTLCRSTGWTSAGVMKRGCVAIFRGLFVALATSCSCPAARPAASSACNSELYCVSSVAPRLNPELVTQQIVSAFAMHTMTCTDREMLQRKRVLASAGTWRVGADGRGTTGAIVGTVIGRITDPCARFLVRAAVVIGIWNTFASPSL